MNLLFASELDTYSNFQSSLLHKQHLKGSPGAKAFHGFGSKMCTIVTVSWRIIFQHVTVHKTFKKQKDQKPTNFGGNYINKKPQACTKIKIKIF